MRKRRRDEQREPEQRRPLERVDPGTRAGVLEQLQQAGGNRAVQEIVAGARLQRDTTTTTKPQKAPAGQTAAASWVLSLDGKVVGSVRSVAGLTVRSEVVEEATVGGHVRKHAGSPQVEPGVLEVGLGMGKAFYEWLDDSMNSKIVQKQVTLHHVAGSRETAKLDLSDVIVTGVEVPQLAAGDTGATWLKVRIAAQLSRRSEGSGTKLDATPTSDPFDPSSARLEVSGIGGVAELKSIAPWTYGVSTKFMPRGGLEATTHRFGNLVVTVGPGAAGGFDAWHEETVQGKRSEETERTVVLSVTSKGGRKLQLAFSGVGIFSASQLAGSGGREYGLYVEGAELKVL